MLGTLLAPVLVACGGDGGGAAPPPAEPRTDWSRAVTHSHLDLDLATLTGRAVVTAADADSGGLSLAADGLSVDGVRWRGGPLPYRVVDGRLDIGMPDTDGATDITIAYGFATSDALDGWNAAAGHSFLWPDFCANLYPCRPDPADGQTFSMEVSGGAPDETVIHPASIPTPAPGYVPAIVRGDYTRLDLDTTDAGTRVSVWYLPGQAEDALAGTAHLPAVMQFYETRYGPYPYGDAVGSVSVAWGGNAIGGMEHHPFWHVAAASLSDPAVHAHEAAHGWYGNGVRMACWEDFVLSEGTASYMAARALGAQGVDLWPEYACSLRRICTDDARNTVARPDGCNDIAILDHPIWSRVPYMKGAWFLREVAAVVGAEPLDDALADFHAARVGSAARMADLVDALAARFPSEAAVIRQRADGWLHQRACPAIPDAGC